MARFLLYPADGGGIRCGAARVRVRLPPHDLRCPTMHHAAVDRRGRMKVWDNRWQMGGKVGL
jgi:hypothetical protein